MGKIRTQSPTKRGRHKRPLFLPTTASRQARLPCQVSRAPRHQGPPKHDEQPPATSQTVLPRAQPHIPDHLTITQHLLSNPPTNSNDKPVLPLALSHIYAAASDIHTLAFRLGLDPADTAKVLPLTDPDAIHRTLLNKGINVLRDMGTITTLEELKPLLQKEGSHQIYANGHWAIWTHKKAYQHYKLSPTRHIYSFPNSETTIASNERARQELSQEELKLIRLTAPKHPLATTETIPTLAYLAGTTPDAAQDYLDRGALSPAPPVRTQCPLLTSCHTQCAKLQEHHAQPFPITHDGDYHSCRYWTFLSAHTDSDPKLRAMAAALLLDREIELRKNPKHNRQLQVHTTSTDSTTSPQDKHSTLPAQVDTKDRNNAQPSLF